MVLRNEWAIQNGPQSERLHESSDRSNMEVDGLPCQSSSSTDFRRFDPKGNSEQFELPETDTLTVKQMNRYLMWRMFQTKYNS